MFSVCGKCSFFLGVFHAYVVDGYGQGGEDNDEDYQRQDQGKPQAGVALGWFHAPHNATVGAG